MYRCIPSVLIGPELAFAAVQFMEYEILIWPSSDITVPITAVARPSIHEVYRP